MGLSQPHKIFTYPAFWGEEIQLAQFAARECIFISVPTRVKSVVWSQVSRLPAVTVRCSRIHLNINFAPCMVNRMTCRRSLGQTGHRYLT